MVASSNNKDENTLDQLHACCDEPGQGVADTIEKSEEVMKSVPTFHVEENLIQVAVEMNGSKFNDNVEEVYSDPSKPSGFSNLRTVSCSDACINNNEIGDISVGVVNGVMEGTSSEPSKPPGFSKTLSKSNLNVSIHNDEVNDTIEEMFKGSMDSYARVNRRVASWVEELNNSMEVGKLMGFQLRGTWEEIVHAISIKVVINEYHLFQHLWYREY